jgi:hypothetical protein
MNKKNDFQSLPVPHLGHIVGDDMKELYGDLTTWEQSFRKIVPVRVSRSLLSFFGGLIFAIPSLTFSST